MARVVTRASDAAALFEIFDLSHATMRRMAWTDVVGATGAASTPVVVAVLAFVFARSQSRSEELLKVRLEYYKVLAPDLNSLMCYMTFIGT